MKYKIYKNVDVNENVAVYERDVYLLTFFKNFLVSLTIISFSVTNTSLTKERVSLTFYYLITITP